MTVRHNLPLLEVVNDVDHGQRAGMMFEKYMYESSDCGGNVCH